MIFAMYIRRPSVQYIWQHFSCLSHAAESVSQTFLSNDMDISFLGTSSAIPTISRGTSCVGLRYSGDVWLFDAGEGTQRQFQHSQYRPSMVTKIFISHMHGDHVFGLPGLLCSLGLAQTDNKYNTGIDIYGPEGLREFLYTAVLSTFSTVVPRFRVHELKGIPCRSRAPERERPRRKLLRSDIVQSFLRAEDIDRSMDLYPDSSGIYSLVSPDDSKLDGQNMTASNALSVRAAPMDHTIPCVGFVVVERDRQGTLHPERVAHIIQQNSNKLKEHFNIADPRYVYKLVKKMLPGESLTFPDGSVVNASDVMDPPRRGRKVVIMGDTCSGEFIRDIAMDADVLVHEATNAWIQGVTDLEGKYATPQELERELISRGHSSPKMAGKFAASIRARHLVLTHFSARFGGGDLEVERRAMKSFERIAYKAATSAGQLDVEVTAANDFLVVNVGMIPRTLL